MNTAETFRELAVELARDALAVLEQTSHMRGPAFTKLHKSAQAVLSEHQWASARQQAGAVVEAQQEHAVWNYIAKHPGCTARDVARDVFGGTGEARTTERTTASARLRALERDGSIVRERGAVPGVGDFPADAWFARRAP